MGNIRQTTIKNIANDLLKAYPTEFKKNAFQQNKLKVAELTDVKSIVLRNRIAGYINRILSPREKKTIVSFDNEQSD